MALSNRDRIERIMDALKEGLGPFVIREYRMVYRRDFAREIDAVLTTRSSELPREAFDDLNVLMDTIDAQGWLNLIWRRWNEVFQEKLGHTGRSYVSELITARNDWAHQKAFSSDDAYRVADTAVRLLEMVSAAEAAAYVKDMANDLLRMRFDAEAKKAKKTNGLPEALPGNPLGLKPWRLIVEPHPDVASGRFMQAEFAADLAQVLRGQAEPEYQNPVEFFRRTYITEGLRDMLVTGVQRLTGQGGDPVVQLQTSFGGGKTHSMLALYHLAGGGLTIQNIPDGEAILERAGNVDIPECNRAVLVGTAINPANPREYDGLVTHTLWGEMAFQLGDVEGYEIVEAADLKGVNPGSDTLLEVLERFGPCLIIIDELVAYARNVYGVEGLPAGSFDAIMSFMQSLTEAVKRSSDSMLLVSIPASKVEIGGEGGREALDMITKTLGRVEAIWKPVAPNESFEIVRRRLFTSKIDYPARDAVLDEFSKMYRTESNEFPSGVGEGDYLERMRSAYPIHPELFDRLYQDWSTLERFQRTRGVLRLMASVIHDLWIRGDQSLLIMPGTVPLDSTRVRDEMLRYLPENWSAIVDTDIDGVNSRPFALDEKIPALGRLAASRRVARSVFIGSAPSVADQSVRGIEEVRVRLATAQPGETLAIFSDALRRLGNELTYLYSDGSRYWYDTRPTVNRIAADRAQSIEQAYVLDEIIARLRRVKPGDTFSAAHIAPASSADVMDEPRVRVVVLSTETPHRRSTNGTDATEFAYEILESRGTASRLYRNMLVFIAPDASGAEALEEGVRDYLAWKTIERDEDSLNLDAQQRKQVRANLDRTYQTIESRIQEAYCWLLVPEQPDPLEGILWSSHRISGSDNFYERASRKLGQNAWLIQRWSPDNLRMELDKYLWRESDHVSLRKLWDYFAQYCYLPRLFDHEVLLNAVFDGVTRQDAPFAYAAGIDAQGRYTGLAYRVPRFEIYFDGHDMVVHPDAAQRQIDEEQTASIPAHVVVPPRSVESEGIGTIEPSLVQPKRVTRYYGDAHINPQRINREFPDIVDEVVQHLTSLAGCDVRIRIEIQAFLPEGFDDTTIRTVNENSKTLKFDNFGFEGD